MTDQTRDGNEAPLGVVSSSSSDELAMAVERDIGIMHRHAFFDSELIACARANAAAMHPASNLADLLSHIADRIEALDARLHVIRNEKCKRCALTKAECADAIAEIEIGRLAARQEGGEG